MAGNEQSQAVAVVAEVVVVVMVVAVEYKETLEETVVLVNGLNNVRLFALVG